MRWPPTIGAPHCLLCKTSAYLAIRLGDEPVTMASEFSSQERANDRAVVGTSFSEKSSRPAWQSALNDLVTKLEELRAAVESVLLSVLPFLHNSEEAVPHEPDVDWTSYEPANPAPVQSTAFPESVG